LAAMIGVIVLIPNLVPLVSVGRTTAPAGAA
jgi:hypothetical protein